MVCATLLAGAAFGARSWQSIKDDGLHDATNPSIELLQEPQEALAQFPQDAAGNKVNWVTALQDGTIRPRSGIDSNEQAIIRDSAILMTNTSNTPFVLFPHRPHTEWMTCEVCHEDLFRSEVGANNIGMGHILEGEFCGRCHGAVAFPLTECNRCHSVNPDQVPEYLADQLGSSTTQ
jgi:c(7)-type cytochrome triheme protein